jgi:hypothetical protein
MTYVPPARTLLEFYTDRQELWHHESVRQVQFPSTWAGAHQPRLVVVQRAPQQHEMVAAAAASCLIQCSLVVAMDYDPEGAVFSLTALQTLDEVRLLRLSHNCFWHLSDWELPAREHDQVDMQQSVAHALPPLLDVVCLHIGHPLAPPESARISWDSDVNRQLAFMIKAFAPAFAARYLITVFCSLLQTMLRH